MKKTRKLADKDIRQQHFEKTVFINDNLSINRIREKKSTTSFDTLSADKKDSLDKSKDA